MKFRVLLVAFTLFLGHVFSYGQLLQWNTFGNLGTETIEPSVANDVNITAANLTLGTITAAANGNRFGGSGWFSVVFFSSLLFAFANEVNGGPCRTDAALASSKHE